MRASTYGTEQKVLRFSSQRLSHSRRLSGRLETEYQAPPKQVLLHDAVLISVPKWKSAVFEG